MLFYRFQSQEDRRAFGGSAFIELQFCKLPENTPIKKIVDTVKHWENDSLYIENDNFFYTEYSRFFDCGTYQNLERGTMDLYGINYYTPQQVHEIRQRIDSEKPTEYYILLKWMQKSETYNGMYILGL